MIDYILKKDNFLSCVLCDVLDIFPGAYGYFYNKNKIDKQSKIKDTNIINPYAYEINSSKYANAVFAKGYGIAIVKNINLKYLKTAFNSNFKTIFYLDSESQNYDSIVSFYILKNNNYKDYLKLKDKVYLQGFDEEFNLCKLAYENGFLGVVIEGIAKLEEIKAKYPDLSIICKNPSNDEKALKYADIIIKS